jgi:hypothetical protein
MLCACLYIFNYLDAFLHHELEDFKMHLMHTTILKPFLLHVVSHREQIFESCLIVGQLGFNTINLLIDFINLLIDDLDLNIRTTLLLDY